METTTAVETRTYKIPSPAHVKHENSERAKEWNGTALNTAVLVPLTKKKFTLTGTAEQINNSWRVITKSACIPMERIS